jgi:putative ATPase
MQQPQDLFDLNPEDFRRRPLADRMRPRTLDEFVGQSHLLGPGKPLRRAIESDRLFASMILWGPPGTGKTSLGAVIAGHTRAHFQAISAVLAGLADLRRVIDDARERRKLYGRRTVLLVDEIHRWNRAQQDALLPHVEDGTIILVGATTENPYFEVVRPLLSRARVFRLVPLTQDEILLILRRALADPERGYGDRQVDVTAEALAYLASVAGGDARAALNGLELAVETTPPGPDGVVRIGIEAVREAVQGRTLPYDRGADEHYDTISAFIKSVRGSDPDAALYWLAKMLLAGEDPDFIMRRLLILAAEDVGLADPQAVVVAAACAQALHQVGLPEAEYHLALATLYLATAPKSNSVGAYFKAKAEIEARGPGEVPDHLKDSHRDGTALGHGRGYLYPHDFPGHHVAQRYLPAGVEGGWFRPSDQGYEAEIAARLARWRAALKDAGNTQGVTGAP